MPRNSYYSNPDLKDSDTEIAAPFPPATIFRHIEENISPDDAHSFIQDVVAVLYFVDGEYDPEKVWSSDEIEMIASLIAQYRILPKGA